MPSRRGLRKPPLFEKCQLTSQPSTLRPSLVDGSDASLTIGREARSDQRGFLLAAVGVGVAEWSSHAGAWILEVAIAPP
jgi:hypothetical protein